MDISFLMNIFQSNIVYMDISFPMDNLQIHHVMYFMQAKEDDLTQNDQKNEALPITHTNLES